MDTSFSSLAKVGLLLVVLTTRGAPAARADFGDLPAGSAREINSNLAADHILHRQIRSVASFLQNYCTMNYKFPQQLDDVRYVKSQLAELAPGNPFLGADSATASSVETLSNVGTGGARLSASDDQRFQLDVDYSVSNNMLKQWATHSPDGWQASPGTITALSNDRNMFVVWGAGADGRPIQDELTGEPVLVVGRWVGSQTSDESTDRSTDTDSSD